jgi:hypothetical protein
MLQRARIHVAARKLVVRHDFDPNAGILKRVTDKPAIRQLAADYVDLWEAQIAAAFNYDWAGVLEATNDHKRRTSRASPDQPSHGDGNVDLGGLARRSASCAERVDAVDAKAGGGSGTTNGDTRRG